MTSASDLQWCHAPVLGWLTAAGRHSPSSGRAGANPGALETPRRAWRSAPRLQPRRCRSSAWSTREEAFKGTCWAGHEAAVMGSWRTVNGRRRATGVHGGRVRTRTEALVTAEDRQRRPPAVHPGRYLHAHACAFSGVRSRLGSVRVGAFRVGFVWNVASNRFGTRGSTGIDGEARPRLLQAGQCEPLSTRLRSHAGAGVFDGGMRTVCRSASSRWTGRAENRRSCVIAASDTCGWRFGRFHAKRSLRNPPRRTFLPQVRRGNSARFTSAGMRPVSPPITLLFRARCRPAGVRR